MEKSGRTDRLELYVPRRDELGFRQSLLADPATMTYNAPWYPPDGCVAFPESEWDDFCDQWIGHGPDRFYAYLRRVSDSAFVGEVNYHRPAGCEHRDMGIVVSAAYRGMGYGVEGIRLLVEHAFLVDRIACLQNCFEDTRTAALHIHKAVGFRETGTEEGIVHLELTREEYLTK